LSSTDAARGAIRVAVVGAGLMGRWHARYARRLGAEVAAIVDPSPAAAQALARRAGNAAVFADVGAMLQSVRPHAVHVCTPLSSHFALACQAVQAGAHALVEKPLTPLVAQTHALLELARRHDVQVCPVHQFAFQRGVQRAARALARLGEPLHAAFTICSAGGGASTGEALDAVAADILPHPLSVLQALWPGATLRVPDWTASRSRHGELHAQGSVAGIAVDLTISMGARPTRCELEILCAGGSMHLDFFHGYAVVRRGEPSRADKVSQPFVYAGKSLVVAALNLAGRVLRGEPAYPGLYALLARFYMAVRGEDECPVSAADALAVAVVREHLMRQAMPGALERLGHRQANENERSADRS
jgi:predicted dehydrogenase